PLSALFRGIDLRFFTPFCFSFSKTKSRCFLSRTLIFVFRYAGVVNKISFCVLFSKEDRLSLHVSLGSRPSTMNRYFAPVLHTPCSPPDHFTPFSNAAS